jgi:hypothetical protein
VVHNLHASLLSHIRRKRNFCKADRPYARIHYAGPTVFQLPARFCTLHQPDRLAILRECILLGDLHLQNGTCTGHLLVDPRLSEAVAVAVERRSRSDDVEAAVAVAVAVARQADRLLVNLHLRLG